MTEFVPQDQNYLPADVANNESYEIIFIQHGPQITTEQVVEAYSNGKGENISITPLEEPASIYPVSFENGELHVNRKVDQYLIATPAH